MRLTGRLAASLTLLGPEDVVRLGRLAREVDGLPLALELLARKASTRSLAELGQAARRPLDLTGEQDRPDRHRSLRDTLLWSADALDPEHRRVLRHIGVFRGEFGADAAGAVVPRGDDVPGALRTLVRDALVQVSRRPDGLRVRLLRTVRDLALEGLEETGALAATRARHRRWYADRWRGAPRSDELLLDVHASYADFVEALRTALEDDDQDTVADLAIALARFWAYTDMVGTGVRWLGEVLDSGLPGELERAHVLVMRAVLTLHADPDGSCADLEEALPALEAHVEQAGGGIDVVGVVTPESQHAVVATRNGRIGLLATPATVASGAYDRAVRQADRLVELISVPCPDLAPLIQSGFPVDERVVASVRAVCEPLREAQADTVILGCTHYPLVRPMLQRALGPDVAIIASGAAVAPAVRGGR